MSIKEQEQKSVLKLKQERDDVKDLQKEMNISLKADDSTNKDTLNKREVIYLLSLNWFNLWKQKVDYEESGIDSMGKSYLIILNIQNQVL